MTEDERCRHPDCIYRNRSDPDKSGNCSYMIIEGRSRTARLPERLRLPVNCPFYKPDGTTPPEPEALAPAVRILGLRRSSLRASAVAGILAAST